MDNAWTPKKIEDLLAGVEAKKSAGLIAQEIGVTRNMVIGKLSRMGIRLQSEFVQARKEGRKAGFVEGMAVRRIRSRSASPRMHFQAPIAPLNIPFLELRARQCRWIVCDKGEDEYELPVFCGHPTVGISSWCADHLPVVARKWISKDSPDWRPSTYNKFRGPVEQRTLEVVELEDWHGLRTDSDEDGVHPNVQEEGGEETKQASADASSSDYRENRGPTESEPRKEVA